MSPDALAEALAELRGWHLPEPVSWWPPAPGWWALGLIAIVLATWAGLWLRARRRQGAAAREAERELLALESDYTRGGDAAAFLRGVSRLLRRVCLARFPRREVAGLTGERWLAFLDSQGGGWGFRTGPGRVLADAPYRPVAELPVTELAALVRSWILRDGRRGR